MTSNNVPLRVLTCLSIDFLPIYRSINLFYRLSAYLASYVFFYLTIYVLPTQLSVFSICLFFYLSICLPIRLSIYHRSAYLHITCLPLLNPKPQFSETLTSLLEPDPAKRGGGPSCLGPLLR